MILDGLDESAATALCDAGWTPTRLVEVPTGYLQLCADMGRDVPGEVRKVIESLDGITLRNCRVTNRAEGGDLFFDAARTLRNMNPYNLMNEYEPTAGGQLFPFGQTDYGLFFMMSEELAVYGGYSPYVGLYGSTLTDFMNRIYDDRNPVVLKR